MFLAVIKVHAHIKLLDKITPWCEINRLSINEAKTQYMIFNDSQNTGAIATRIVCNNSPLKLVEN